MRGFKLPGQWLQLQLFTGAMVAIATIHPGQNFDRGTRTAHSAVGFKACATGRAAHVSLSKTEHKKTGDLVAGFGVKLSSALVSLDLSKQVHNLGIGLLGHLDTVRAQHHRHELKLKSSGAGLLTDAGVVLIFDLRHCFCLHKKTGDRLAGL